MRSIVSVMIFLFSTVRSLQLCCDRDSQIEVKTDVCKDQKDNVMFRLAPGNVCKLTKQRNSSISMNLNLKNLGISLIITKQ